MLTVTEYPNRPRATRYVAYVCGIQGDRAVIATGPTAAITLDRADAFLDQGILADPVLATEYPAGTQGTPSGAITPLPSTSTGIARTPMAYFPNSSAGDALQAQCDTCPLGQEPCPILLAQLLYNYDAVGHKVATDILNTLVNTEGQCQLRPLLLARTEPGP